MKFVFSPLVLALLTLSLQPLAHAQASASATQVLGLSAFGGAAATRTGLGSGKNLGIIAGADLSIPHFRSFVPFVEVRGTWPFYDGSTESLKDLLGGVKVARIYSRLQPYGDALYGRAEIDYSNGGYPDPTGTYRYLKSPSNLLSLGGGVDIDLTSSFAIKVDAQWQRYDSPVAASGVLYAVPATLGVVYHFHFAGRR